MRWTCCFGLVLFATAMQAAADERSLVGDWYAEDYQPSVRTTVQEISHRHADGTYEDEFRRYENCVLVLRQKEAGTWILDGDRYRTITLSIDGGAAHFEDEYEVRSLTDTEFQYFHSRLGQLFTDKRVSVNFRFPDCLTS